MEQKELIVDRSYSGLTVECGDFSFTCDNEIEFLETFRSWEKLVKNVSYEEVFNKVLAVHTP